MLFSLLSSINNYLHEILCIFIDILQLIRKMILNYKKIGGFQSLKRYYLHQKPLI